jgi:hypothetical protein
MMRVKIFATLPAIHSPDMKKEVMPNITRLPNLSQNLAERPYFDILIKAPSRSRLKNKILFF